MDEFNYDNEIIELESDTKEGEKEEKTQVTKQKKKEKNKGRWHDLSKGKKALVIILSILFVLLLVGIIVYFVFFRKQTEEEVKDPVIIEKDNYRYENGNLVFLDKTDKEIGTYECVNKESESCYVAKPDYTTDTFDRIKSVNLLGEEIIKNSDIYYDTFVFLKDGEEEFLYNFKTKEKVLEVNNFKTYNTSKDLVVVSCNDNKYGLIEINSANYEYLLKCTYDNLGIINSTLEYLVATEGDKNYIIDTSGKKLSSNIKATITSVSEDYIVGKNDKNNYSLYTYDFTDLMKDYDYIGLHDSNLISLVKDKKLYVIDSNLKKVYEEGIRLNNTNYVKKYVYDDNNNLKETTSSYDIEVKNNELVITSGEDIKIINLFEGAVSAGYSYLNYFDGVLYFYGDNEKEELLGTYKCNNKNNITSSAAVLENCNIYNYSANMSGIYNKQYVFIYDNLGSNDAKIYLYDLKNKKVKGTYSSITFVNPNEISNDILQVSTESSYVICKSAVGENTGKYGMIEIGNGKVSGKIEFKYSDIALNNKYYALAQNNKYAVYDKDLKKISDEFDYVKLYADYYAGVKNKRLNIYRYTSSLSILFQDVEVEDNEFDIDFTNGFTITSHDKTYKYDSWGYIKYGE